MYNFPPSTLYETLHNIPIPGSPVWRYDGQFIWIPLPQMGYDKKSEVTSEGDK